MTVVLIALSFSKILLPTWVLPPYPLLFFFLTPFPACHNIIRFVTSSLFLYRSNIFFILLYSLLTEWCANKTRCYYYRLPIYDDVVIFSVNETKPVHDAEIAIIMTPLNRLPFKVTGNICSSFMSLLIPLG